MPPDPAAPALYFAYGSNLEPVQMAARCPGHRVVGRAVLPDHALGFRGFGRDWAGAVATIEPRAGSRVHGVVFAITAAHYAALDAYEGYDGPGAASNLYDRVAVVVEMEDGRRLPVETYAMRPGQEPAGAPSALYRDAIVAGMRHHGLPAGAIAALEAVPCSRRNCE
jgi:gamma-glutamylcyclotransferase (GGCT)/AIG2-like uncharacterized protein YtfP